MRPKYTAKNNPRVIVIQKLYSVLYNNDEKIEFPKHRFKKFIKDIVLGTIERNEIIVEELDKNLGGNFDFISQSSTNAIMNLAINSKKPIGNGILTCLNINQAKIRKKKGAEAAKAIISVLSQK